MSEECPGYNIQTPRKHLCHNDFNSILTNFNDQGENIVNGFYRSKPKLSL